MPRGTETWSTQQLVELLALMAAFDDPYTAMERGIERTSEALEAEFCAVVRNGEVAASLGFTRSDVPEADLVAIASGESHVLEWAGLRAEAVSVPLEDDSEGRLVLARLEGGFGPDEVHLLRGMARIMALWVRVLKGLEHEREAREESERQAAENARLLTSLRERQALLERLSRIQRSIVHRAALQDVLDGIVAGAGELLGDEVVGLRLVEAHNPGQMALVASSGIPPELLDEVRRGPVGEGIGGLAIAGGELVVDENYQNSDGGLSAYRTLGLRAAMAAPVHENGKPVGSLVVASYRRDRQYSSTEQEMLVAFAEHASLALTDARNFEDAMHQAFHDSLTGLPNRALFLDRLEHAQARARRSKAAIAVLFLDLDSFKNVNDSLGHVAGDELLVLVSGRLRRCLRPSDTAARFGGDEFAVLLEDVGTPGVTELVAERVLAELRAPFEIQGQEVFISASVGIATSEDRGGDDLLRNADLAMYRAKSAGKGRHETFEPGMHAAILERLGLEVDLQRAVFRGELITHYQPIVDLATGTIVATEALLRWRHPTRGMIGPDEFIPLAEETGAIHALGQWILFDACRQTVEWNAGICADAPIRIGVNLSGKQIEDPDLVAQVSGVLSETGLPAEHLILEITETVLMHDLEGTITKLEELRALGIGLSVDDFGTGYSSLQYLRRFPLESLKIAKTFVDGVAGASHDAAVARAVVELGGTFQLNVVAEGVETIEQHAQLLMLGCDYGQGYLFARPAPADLISLTLAQGRLVPG